MTGTEAVWARLHRPFDAVEVADALLGLSMAVTRQLVGAVLATSEEADGLLDAMPHVVRALAVSTTSSPERHHGEVRGPVLWSETMSARASSAGDTGLFVCASPSKAYDTEENRVLVAALDAIRRGAQAIDAHAPAAHDNRMLRRARVNGARAVRFLEHRTLASVERCRPDGRAVRRARAGSRRQTYRPAVAMLDRAAEPLTHAHIARYNDQRTAAQHELLAAVVEGFEARGAPVPPFRAEEGALGAGPIRYIHPRRGGDARHDVHGILIGNVLLDVPHRADERNPFRAQSELEARSGGRRTFVVMAANDVERAVDLAFTYGTVGGAARPDRW
jgi:hypothetical protein